MPTKRLLLCLCSILALAVTCKAQAPDIKFIADTLVVQADGTYEADPDVATLTFDVYYQDKDLKLTYEKATAAIRKISDLAVANGLRNEDVTSGVLTVTPIYSGDRKKRTSSFVVRGKVRVKLRDFSKIGPILDGSITEGVTDFRSLDYSLADEEAAKQKAVAEAMRRAVARANAALTEKGQKAGTLRFASVDVKQLIGIENLGLYGGNFEDLVQLAQIGAGADKHRAAAPPAPPPPLLSNPDKISVSATVQCAFQIL
jgi:uncharacterized protein